jgi:hypothetical protein
MRLAFAVLGVFIIVGIVDGQPKWTKELNDGTVWRSLPDATRLGYIAGFSEGLGQGITSNTTDVKEIDRQTRENWPDLTFGEVKEAVDHFYQTPENRPLPIITAIRVAAMRSSGMTQAQIATFVSAMRQKVK